MHALKNLQKILSKILQKNPFQKSSKNLCFKNPPKKSSQKIFQKNHPKKSFPKIFQKLVFCHLQKILLSMCTTCLTSGQTGKTNIGCPRGWHFSAQWGPNWRQPLKSLNTIECCDTRVVSNWAPIMPRERLHLSDSYTSDRWYFSCLPASVMISPELSVISPVSVCQDVCLFVFFSQPCYWLAWFVYLLLANSKVSFYLMLTNSKVCLPFVRQ